MFSEIKFSRARNSQVDLGHLECKLRQNIRQTSQTVPSESTLSLKLVIGNTRNKSPPDAKIMWSLWL